MRTAILAGLGLLTCAAYAAQPCFIQRFQGVGNLGGFDGGSTYANPGSGGVEGDGDGYLRVSNAQAAFFGVRYLGPEFTGNYVSTGVVRVTFWLNDIGEPNELRIHLGIGQNQNNFWQLNEVFVPAHNEWRKFSAEITLDPADWTSTIGLGELSKALAFADRFHIRHDLPPYLQAPNPIAADMGIDNVRVIASGCDCPEDVNDDGAVTFADLNYVLSDYNRAGIGLPGDVDFSGAVTFDDLNRVLSVFNAPCP